MALGGRRMSLPRCTAIKGLLEDTNWPVEQIALHVQVHPKTIKRMRLSYELFGTPYPPKVVNTGRPRALTGAHEQVTNQY